MQNEEGDFNYDRYARAIEDNLETLAAKNGVVMLRQIHLETAIPIDL
mgnify:FL=1